MTQPLGPYAQTRWPDDHPDSTPPPLSTNRRPPDPPEPPELPDFDAEAYAQAARSMGLPPTTENPALEALGALHHAGDAVVQQRLDAFRAQATPTYHTPSGDVQVATPFWLSGYPLTPKNQEEVKETCLRLGLNASETHLLQEGRGTPEQVQRVTQALIDAGALPRDDGRSADDRVRRMMYDHGIGLDCAGYVAQAFVASRDVDRAHSPLASIPLGSEQLSNLQNRGFMRVGLDAARPGDVVVLGIPANDRCGHCVIVYAARQATDADKQFLRDCAEKAWRNQQSLRTSDPAAYGVARDQYDALIQIAASANLRVLVVDSSWGSHQEPQWGGVERRMWWHDDLCGPWVSTNRGGAPQVSATPYDHPVDGAYRPRTEP